MIFDENTYEIVCNRFGIIVNDWIAKDELQYIQMNTHESMRVEENFRHYIYKDKYDKAGDTGSYFWQDLWAAKKLSGIIRNNITILGQELMALLHIYWQRILMSH